MMEFQGLKPFLAAFIDQDAAKAQHLTRLCILFKKTLTIYYQMSFPCMRSKAEPEGPAPLPLLFFALHESIEEFASQEGQELRCLRPAGLIHALGGAAVGIVAEAIGPLLERVALVDA